VNVNVPAVVGAPEMEAGGDGARLRPGGSCPELMDQVYGCTPPEAKKFCEKDVLTVPAGQQELGKVIARGVGGLIVMLKACCAVSPTSSCTCTVNVKDPLWLGVPPMTVPPAP
jgi:hypothetical protein